MSLKEERKQKEIDLCGKRLDIHVNDDGILVARVMYCNYYLDCDPCFGRQKYKRKKDIENIFDSYHGALFRAVVTTEEWDTIARQIRRKSLDYVRIPQNDKYLIISSGEPYVNDERFCSVSSFDARMELSQEENLFTNRMRSSSRNWPLTKKKEEYSATIEVEILIPSFVPSSESNGTIELSLEKKDYLHASTWTRGKITFDNVQEYSNYRMNKLIGLALERGLIWKMEDSKLRTVTYGLEQIERWSVASVNKPNMSVTGETNRYKSNRGFLLEINAVEPDDYVGMFKEYLEQKQQEQNRFPEDVQWAFGE